MMPALIISASSLSSGALVWSAYSCGYSRRWAALMPAYVVGSSKSRVLSGCWLAHFVAGCNGLEPRSLVTARTTGHPLNS